MRKLTYRSDLPGRHRPTVNRTTNLSESFDTHTEMGSGGSLIEGTGTDSSTPHTSKDPDLYEEPAYTSEQDKLDDELMEIFIELGDAMDLSDEEVLADFADFMIQKYASSKEAGDPTVLFNNLLIKINNADLTNTNDILKKLTKIYSRTIRLEYFKHKNMEKAKESAYKKTLHRADQYLSME